VKLLLDEMISPAIARRLRELGHDVQAIKRDRVELEGLSDRELVEGMQAERRAIVTNDVADFQPLHDRLVAAGGGHYGMLFTSDQRMPRTKAGIAGWVDVLDAFLREHRDEAALRNRVAHLP
jgi:Domain of unknown function (DUF5615)